MVDLNKAEKRVLEKRVRKTFHAEQKRKQLKMKANLMHAKGYSTHDIANYLGISEGAVHYMISVNGGY